MIADRISRTSRMTIILHERVKAVLTESPLDRRAAKKRRDWADEIPATASRLGAPLKHIIGDD